MQSFDEDMGELFRKASAEIRLKPLEDDWDKIKESLLPDPVFLPLTEYRISAPDVHLEVMIAFFLVGMFTISSIVLRESQINKRVPVVQTDISQITGSLGEPAIVNEKNVQIQYAGHVSKSLKSFALKPGRDSLTTMTAGSSFAADRSESKSSVMRSLLPGDLGILVDFNQTPYAQKITTNHVEEPKEKTSGKRIYGGIIAGPQFSQTKQQGFGNAGLSAGLIAGFRFTKQLSIETGFTISNKQFSSAGEYFDMSKIAAAMPSGMKLLQIHSTNTVLEIPFNVNYEVVKLRKGRIFTSGGISSYIITNEHNQYQASINGAYETLTGNYSVRQSYFAAAANMGLGYEWNAGNGLNLRVNPYVQIPLKMIGMGSMPVVSTGIYLGILFPIIK